MSQAYEELPVWEKSMVDGAAVELMKAGAYRGSESDARTDCVDIVKAIRFSPTGDNHHNALLCPYCFPLTDDEFMTLKGFAQQLRDGLMADEITNRFILHSALTKLVSR